MFKPNILKAKVIEKGSSISKLANAIGKNEATFYRKLARNGDFSRFEILRISEELNLRNEERDSIFFG